MVELEASLGDRHGGFDDAGFVVDRRLVAPVVVVVVAAAADRLHRERFDWAVARLLVLAGQLRLLVGHGGLVVDDLGQGLVVGHLVPRLHRLGSFFLFFAA